MPSVIAAVEAAATRLRTVKVDTQERDVARNCNCALKLIEDARKAALALHKQGMKSNP
jgi:hypothetical protein